ncbi:hypothetical protein ASH01_19930 [Terrabacter sp. Soil811]|nr:hypothetical protein ASH01_19930 [Terrabacter sp. Soil811]
MLAGAALVAAPLAQPAQADDTSFGAPGAAATVPAAIMTGPAAPKKLVTTPGKPVAHRGHSVPAPTNATLRTSPTPVGGTATLALDGDAAKAGTISARLVTAQQAAAGAPRVTGSKGTGSQSVNVKLTRSAGNALTVTVTPLAPSAPTTASTAPTSTQTSTPRPKTGSAAGAAAGAELLIDVSAFPVSGDALTRLVATRAGKAIPVTAVPKGSATAAAPGRTASGDTTVRVPVSLASASVTTLTTGASGASGDYAATDLSPASTWGTSEQFGAFTWSYPVTTPASAGGLDPDLSIGYASTSVDGRLSSTNNQPSWVGEGFSLDPGHVDRAFASCTQDATAGSNNAASKTGDLCWKNDNASITFNGSATRLVKDASDATGQTWRLENDDNSKVEHLTGAANGDGGSAGTDGAGEYWRLTTTDGTQYYFGKAQTDGTTPVTTQSTWTVPVNGNDPGEPCYNSSFASAFCNQAWRWNLDYVVDAHGNSMTYQYTKELNQYGQNRAATSVSYVRGGHLSRISYGQTRGTESASNDTARVEFTVAERCVPRTGVTCQVTTPDELTDATKDAWPDVPFDMICAPGATCTTSQSSPTFFTRKKLTAITTKVLRAGALTDVSRVDLSQSFPPTGDLTSPALFLDSVTTTGLVGGSASLPPIQFGKQQRENRVDSNSDGSLPMYKYRVNSVSTESGASITVVYMGADCTTKPTDPQTNTKRCFPSYWYPNGSQTAVLDWFHTYPVASITEDGGSTTSLPTSTSWTYTGGAAWHLDNSPVPPDGKHTWSDFRGFGTVTTRVGDLNEPTPILSKSTYLRGMGGTVTASDGTTVTDKDQFNGFTLEDTTYNGATVLERNISIPWTSAETARDAFGPSFVTGTETSRAITATSAGDRTTESTTTFTPDGYPSVVDDLGDKAVTGDDRCTRTTYAAVNTAKNLRGLVSTEATVAVPCSATPNKLTDTISETRTYYDGSSTLTSIPATGDVTRTESLAEDAAGTGTRYVQASKTVYDTVGRPVETYDPLGKKSTTTYTPADHTPTTGILATNPLGHTITSTLDPALGQPTKVTDANGRDTVISYDPLGRRTKVWTGSRAITAVPNLEYTYQLSKTAPSVVTTKTLLANGTSQVASTALFDGLLRPLQTQTPVQYDTVSGGVGRALSDVVYDSRGLTVTERGPWPDSATAPGATYVSKQTQEVGRAVLTEYDGAGRATASSLMAFGTVKSKTSTVYNGDSTDTLPPAGASATRAVVDGRGRTTALRVYKGNTITGTPVTTSYTVNNKDQMVGMTDTDGSTWTWTYDLLGRKTRSVDPDSGTSTSTYDDAGRVTTTTDGRGTVLTYGYDDLGRKTSLKQGATTLATWAYDGANVTGGVPNSIGRPTRSSRLVTTTVGTTTTTSEYATTVDGYTNDGQPTKTTTTVPAAETGLAGSYVRNNYWNANGQLSWTTMPTAPGFAAESQAYNYDLTGRASRLTAGASIVSAVQRDEFGAVGHYQQSAVSGIGVIVDQLYEAGTHRLQTLSMWRPPSTTITKPELYTTYTYNAAGQITTAKDEPDTATPARTDRQCYQYDPLGHLTQAWTQSAATCALPTDTTYTASGPAPYWASWTVADDGRRLSETQHATSSANNVTIGYTYPAATVHPTPAAPTPAHAPSNVSRTAAGATVNFPGGYTGGGATTRSALDWSDSTMTWDSENHLATVTRAGKTTTANVYDADGNLLVKAGLDGSRSLMLGDTQISYTPAVGATPAVTKAKRLYMFEGQVVGVRTGTGTAGIYYTPPGAQGTAPLQVNANSNAVTKRYYTPYGDDRTATAGWQSFGGFLSGSGATTDALSGLTHLGARDYDPNLGRFLSTDPVLQPDDPSQLAAYGYSGNDPVNHSDPTGLARMDGDIGPTAKQRAQGKKTYGPIIRRQRVESYRKSHDVRQESHYTQRLRASNNARKAGFTKYTIPGAGTFDHKNDTASSADTGGAAARDMWDVAWAVVADDFVECGRGNGGSCAWAAVGLIPGGKLAKGLKVGIEGGEALAKGTHAAVAGEDTVSLFKASQKGLGESHYANGYKPADFPGNGAYFAREKEIADSYASHYGEGVIETRVPRGAYDEHLAQYEMKYLGAPPGTELAIPPHMLDFVSQFERIWH